MAKLPTAISGGVDRGPSVRATLRVVVTVVASAFALIILYRLRTPLSYLAIALFVAVCASAPVSVLSRYMKRGFAILVVYGAIILIPIGIGAILIPPGVNAVSDLVNDLPGYVDDLDRTIQENDRLRQLNQDFDVVGSLQDVANDASSGALGNAAGTLTDVGGAIVSGLFALVTILVLSMFMVARGPRWVEAFLHTRPRQEAEVLRRAFSAMAGAVSSYVAGAIVQALVAGTASFIVLLILGVPSPLALAVIIAILDVIPLVGATIGAVIVGLFTLFTGFPVVTIVWAVFAIAYQQFENYVVQPKIQSRAVDLDPFIVVIAALFGGTLFGIIGALVAIPVAAAIQIGVKEFFRYRREASTSVEAPEAEPA